MSCCADRIIAKNRKRHLRTLKRTAVGPARVVTEKQCRSCGETLPVSQMRKRKTSLDGYDTQCKPCFNAAKRAARA